MSEQIDVELFVKGLEAAIPAASPNSHLTDLAPFLRALIADWRKRGEALEWIAEQDKMWAGKYARAALTTQQQPPAAP